MSDMKCPFCGQTIVCTDAQVADENSTWFCPRCIAERNWYAFGNETLWQEFLRTRKALDVAVDEITKIKVAAESVGIGFFMTAAIFALAKIKTALEQKDVK